MRLPLASVLAAACLLVAGCEAEGELDAASQAAADRLAAEAAAAQAAVDRAAAEALADGTAAAKAAAERALAAKAAAVKAAEKAAAEKAAAAKAAELQAAAVQAAAAAATEQAGGSGAVDPLAVAVADVLTGIAVVDQRLQDGGLVASALIQLSASYGRLAAAGVPSGVDEASYLSRLQTLESFAAQAAAEMDYLPQEGVARYAVVREQTGTLLDQLNAALGKTLRLP